MLGDIGQGSRAARKRRGFGNAASSEETQFECLRCGEITMLQKIAARPQCLHCSSRDGVIVEGDV